MLTEQQYIYFDIGGSYSAYMASNVLFINVNQTEHLKQNIRATGFFCGQLAKVCRS